jgi:hypothetical protein
MNRKRILVAAGDGENFDARRVQRFLYKGMGSPNSAEGVIPPARAVQ